MIRPNNDAREPDGCPLPKHLVSPERQPALESGSALWSPLGATASYVIPHSDLAEQLTGRLHLGCSGLFADVRDERREQGRHRVPAASPEQQTAPPHGCVKLEGPAPASLAAAVFILYAQQIYESIGVEVNCTPNDDTPTVQYEFPDTGVAAYVEPNRQLLCGGYGWFISSNELANVLTNLRNTENLLSTESRATMQEGFLGFMDPANYGFIGGTFGVYSMHGGDWFHSSGDLHACVVAFPIQVEVGLVINSGLGGGSYQCAVLQTAFDNAWVQN